MEAEEELEEPQIDAARGLERMLLLLLDELLLPGRRGCGVSG
jgi:hypothetical protein